MKVRISEHLRLYIFRLLQAALTHTSGGLLLREEDEDLAAFQAAHGRWPPPSNLA
jgi:hypothetical protein